MRTGTNARRAQPTRLVGCSPTIAENRHLVLQVCPCDAICSTSGDPLILRMGFRLREGKIPRYLRGASVARAQERASAFLRAIRLRRNGRSTD